MDRLPRLQLAQFALLLLGPVCWSGCGSGDTAAPASAKYVAPHVAPTVAQAPQTLPATGAPSHSVAGASSQAAPTAVLSAAYALPDSGSTSQASDSPRVRLAQARPIPMWDEGPDWVPPQAGRVTPNSAAATDSPSRSAEQLARITSPSSTRSSQHSGPAPFHPTPHSAEMDAVIHQADEHNRHGFELAEHGAIYSARAEFLAAARLIAEALDGLDRGSSHQESLAAGLKALDEVDDFAHYDDVPSGASLEAIIAGHQTPALKDTDSDHLTAAAAISIYLTFAGQQFAAAETDISAGSTALFGLGKIYMVPPSAHGPSDATHGGKAVAIEQAALLVDGRNARAANELGVLLVQFGRLPEAKAAFLRSVMIAPQPNTWKNLAVVHHNLGENELADKAWNESLLLAKQIRATGVSATTSGYAVQWVDPATFARSSPLPIDGTPPDRQPGSVNPSGAQHSVAGSPPWATSQRQ